MNESLIRAVRSALRKERNEEDAEQMRRYMKSEMPYLGLKKPVRVNALRPVFAKHPVSDLDDLMSTVRALWRDAKYREERYAALDLTGLHRKMHSMKTLPMYEQFIVDGAWWDYVDTIASGRFVWLFEADPEKMKKRMMTWTKRKNFWIRRASIIGQLKRKESTDLELLETAILRNIEDPEFFIRKAIGWSLRQYSYVDPDWVVRFVKKHKNALSPLSKREAFKALLRKGRVERVP